MTRNDSIARAADRLWQAVANGTPCTPIRDLIGDGDVHTRDPCQALGDRRQNT